MDTQEQIDRLRAQIGAWGRDDWHQLRGAIDATGMAMAVMQERQKVTIDLLTRMDITLNRLDDKSDLQTNRLTILETKAVAASDAARSSGAKWGAGVGAFVAAAIAGLWQVFGGTQK